MTWLISAVLSAVFAGITAILAKCGIKNTNSNVATAVRTIVVLFFSMCMVTIVGSWKSIEMISRESWIFLVLSGLSTGASWIFYFKALSIGDVNKVAPIDKSSTVLTVLMAIVSFQETNRLAVKLIATAMIGIGTYLMVWKQTDCGQKSDKLPLLYAGCAALFAALTSILAKLGIAGVESNLATTIRTAVVLIMAWAIVFAKKEHKQVLHIDRKELRFIALSGVATGASWLCYYYAVQNGPLSIVVPIDKMSILVTIVFARVWLKEKLEGRALLGLCLLCAGTLVMAILT